MNTSINGITSRDIYVLSAAATGAAINRADDISEIKSYLLFGGSAMALPTVLKGAKALAYDFPIWTYNNYGNYKTALLNKYNSTIGKTNIYKINRNALKGNFINTVNDKYLQGQLKAASLRGYDINALEAEKRNLERLSKLFEKKESDKIISKAGRSLKRNANKRALITNANNFQKAEIYKETNRLLAEANGLKGKELAAKLKEIKIAETKAKIAVQQAKAAGTIKSTTKVGRAASWIKTKTGARALQTKVLEGTLSSNTAVRTVAKGVKAGGGMFLISAAMEAPNVVKTYKELGGKKGTKQLAKSTAKVAAETAGFIVGTKVAGIAGAKIGATIGTAIGGPVGTAIGAVVGGAIGVIGGLLGSWLFGKATKAVVGEDELVKAKKEQAEALAAEIKKNPELQTEVALTAKEQLESGNITSEKDANDVIASFNNVAEYELRKQKQEQPALENDYQNNLTGKASNQRVTTDSGLNALLTLASGNFSNNYNTMNLTNYTPYKNVISNSFMNPFMPNFMSKINYFNQFMRYNNPAA